MIRPQASHCVLVVALTLAACTGPTVLKIDTDPQGADVESRALGYLGTTPMERQFTDAELEKVAVAGNVYVDVKISKRDYVSIDLRNVSFAEGSTFPIRKTLELRLTKVEITTEPDGVGVFQLLLDRDAPANVKTLFDNDPYRASEDHERWITRRFIGSTPTQYSYDVESPLEHNDPLLFLKAGYHPEVSYFKATQPRLHQVMRPLVELAR